MCSVVVACALWASALVRSAAFLTLPLIICSDIGNDGFDTSCTFPATDSNTVPPVCDWLMSTLEATPVRNSATRDFHLRCSWAAQPANNSMAQANRVIIVARSRSGIQHLARSGFAVAAAKPFVGLPSGLVCPCSLALFEELFLA